MTRTTALLVLLTAAAPTVGATGISVSIAIPTRDGARRIAVGTAKPHLHVLVRNIVDTAQRIWDETFSLGYYALFSRLSVMMVRYPRSARRSGSLRAISPHPGRSSQGSHSCSTCISVTAACGKVCRYRDPAARLFGCAPFTR
jgi:hypothetical protein